MRGSVAYILCSTRSGSTWLALMLGSNRDARYVGELSRMYRPDPEGCSLCTERGQWCPVFHDIRECKPGRVHQELLSRTGARVLIDNSKSLSWARKTLSSVAEKQYIHLLRDPRAVVYSWERRGRPKGLQQWIDENYNIRRFGESLSLSMRTVTYNALADSTDSTMSGLCEWLGLTYDAAQKSYWEVEHHGAGRNGATASFLNDYVASDEAFYSEHRRTQFNDLRWQSALDAKTRESIERDASLRRFLDEFGLALRPEGLV